MYHDQVGLPTIGVGHLLTKDELSSGKIRLGGIPIRWYVGLTDAEVDAVLSADVERVERVINANVGVHAFMGSTLLKLLNQDRFATVPDQMRRWIHFKGQVVPALVSRREREV